MIIYLHVSQISCNVTARYTTSPLNPWCIPKTVRHPFFAGLKVSDDRGIAKHGHKVVVARAEFFFLEIVVSST